MGDAQKSKIHNMRAAINPGKELPTVSEIEVYHKKIVADELLMLCLSAATTEPGIYPVRGRNWTKAELRGFQQKVREAHWVKNAANHG